MALGKVTVNNLNQYQSAPDEVERRFVFIGQTAITELHGVVTELNSNTDFEAMFTPSTYTKSTAAKSNNAKTTKSSNTKEAKSVEPTSLEDSYAYKDLVAAQLNAGQNWTAAYVGIAAGGDWTAALDIAIKHSSYEAVVVCDPAETKAALEAAKTKMVDVQNKKAQYMFAMLRTKAIDPDTQNWSHFQEALSIMANGFVSERVMCIPTLFENDLGILAGRLCNRTVTVADSPMRTATGTLIGMGNPSQDKSDQDMPDTIFAALDGYGYSVPQTYPGEDGWYWADGNTFDLETGDYKVIEHLRVVLKACRQVYKIAVPTVADRSLNNTAQGIEKYKGVFKKPLLTMAKARQINGVPFPGEIHPPGETAIEINWISLYKVEIYITVRPYGSPKDITIGVGVDLSDEEEG